MKKKEKYGQFLARSDEFQEIIGTIPPWIIRRGISVTFWVFLIFLFCSFYIKYPDTLQTQVMVLAKEQPFKISYFSEGTQTYQALKNEGDWVNVNDTILLEKDITTGKTTKIISSVSGKMYLFKGAEKDPRELVMLVYPEINDYDIQLNIPVKGSGKVRATQDVLIKLEAYPVDEYGYLEGKIESIMPVQIDGFHRAKIKLKNNFITSENKQIKQQHFMKGWAEIILDDKNLFQRYFGSFFD